jgi:hypothetical protein
VNSRIRARQGDAAQARDGEYDRLCNKVRNRSAHGHFIFSKDNCRWAASASPGILPSPAVRTGMDSSSRPSFTSFSENFSNTETLRKKLQIRTPSGGNLTDRKSRFPHSGAIFVVFSDIYAGQCIDTELPPGVKYFPKKDID